MDLLLPCKNPVCESKWFVFDNSTKPRCPFCGKEYSEKLAILNFYYQTDKGTYLYENYRLMIYDKQYLYKWHINNLTTSEDMFLYENRIPVGDFYLSNGKWYLRNLALDNLYDKDLNIKIEIYTKCDSKEVLKGVHRIIDKEEIIVKSIKTEDNRVVIDCKATEEVDMLYVIRKISEIDDVVEVINN